jgi:divalent metal cation (Fe/Co/Zn/Cd) transporter
MVSTIVVKLVMWVWCRTIKNTSVEALTQDAENDVSSASLSAVDVEADLHSAVQIVFNFFSILFPYVGQLLGWPLLDPIGGLVLSVYSTSLALALPSANAEPRFHPQSSSNGSAPSATTFSNLPAVEQLPISTR